MTTRYEIISILATVNAPGLSKITAVNNTNYTKL